MQIIATMKIVLMLILTLLCRASSSVNMSSSNNITTGINRSIARVDDRQVVYVLVTAPYPDPLDDGWDAGISLIPAVRLAFKQINDRIDILPDYKLKTIEDDSGCTVRTKATTSLFRNVYYHPEQVIGMIGPACSGSTLLLEPILSRPEVSLIQISPTSTSPELVGRNKNSTFTMISPLGIIDSLISLMVQNKWTRVATLYDPVRTSFVHIQEKFLERVSTTTDLNLIYTSHVVDTCSQDQTFFPLHEIAAHRARIVLLFSVSSTVRKILCLAFHMSMLYPKYQWLVLEKSKGELEIPVDSFEHNGVVYNCSKDTMAKALNGVIVNQFKLFQDDEAILSTSNQTYEEYRECYDKEFWKHWNETSVQRTLESITKDKKSFLPSKIWENTYYDAAWAFGIALDRASIGGVNLSQYKWGQPKATRVIAEELQNVTFEGATGAIIMDGSDRAHTTVEIFQLWTSYNSNLTENTLAYYSKEELRFVKPNNDFIKGTFPEVLLRIHYGLSVTLIIITLTVTVVTVLLHIAFITWRNKKGIKATSPKISHLIFSGCYLFSLATILYAIQQSFKLDSPLSELSYSVLCNAITWCLLLGYSLIFGTVLVKIWRVYKLFKHFRNKRPGILLTDNALILAVISLVLIDIIICITWNVVDPWIISKTNTEYSENLTVYITVSCKCNEMNTYYWIGGVAVYKGTIAVLLLVFSFLNRKIQRKHFAHTKKVNILVYIITLLSGVGFPLYFLLTNTNIYIPFLILCTILIVTVVVCCLMLFLPPVLPILRNTLRGKKEKVTRGFVRSKISTTSIV